MNSNLFGMPIYYHDITMDVKKLLEDVAVKGINLQGEVSIDQN